MFLIAEPLRNLGKYTFADVVAFRLRQAPGARSRRRSAACSTVLFYTIAQMVGAGNLITLLFGLPLRMGRGDRSASVMLAYVLFGGMLATTWVQIIKAVLLLFGVTRADGDWCSRTFDFNLEEPVSRGARSATDRPRSSRAGWSPIRWTRSRSAWR